MLTRAFRILDAFAPEHASMGLTELVRSTGIAKATVHRLACQLVALGILDKVGDRYQPGMHLFELGSMVVGQRRIREAALPFMVDLYEATHETVHLGVPSGTDVLYLEKIVGGRSSPVSTRVGAKKPLHCTALGKAMLAYQPQYLLQEVLRSGLVPASPRTITSPEVFVKELEAVRSGRVAYDHEEYASGVCCVASPVLDQSHLAVASLSISGPSYRFDPERYSMAVRTAAVALTRCLLAADKVIQDERASEVGGRAAEPA